MGHGARLQQLFQRAERGDPVAIALVALVVASILVPILLRLWRYFHRDREGEGE